MRQSHTAVLARNERWAGRVETEPYETAWASEAVFFLRALEPASCPSGVRLRVQISPDGMRWCNEGTEIPLSGDPDTATFARVRHFGGWLRLAGDLPEGVSVTVIAYLNLKE
jgi:hypothetical protein